VAKTRSAFRRSIGPGVPRLAEVYSEAPSGFRLLHSPECAEETVRKGMRATPRARMWPGYRCNACQSI